jgi:acyl-coenzyme A synthetase/AMP-(fatty) acid ligase
VVTDGDVIDQIGRIIEPSRRAWLSPVALGADTSLPAAAQAQAPLTWRDLARAVARLRSLVAARDWRRVLIVCDDRFDLAAALLACWTAGRVAVLPPNGRPDALRRLRDRGAADGVLPEGVVGAALEGADDDDDDVDDVVAATAARCAAVLEGRGTDPLLTLYSSGSTGDAVASHKCAAQLFGEAEALVRAFGLGGAARVLASVPAHHIYGLLFSVLAPLIGGGAFVRQTPLHAETIAALARDCGANVLCSVPPHLHGLQALDGQAGAGNGDGNGAGALAGVARLFCSGARLPPPDARRLRERFGLTATEILGSTETGGIGWRLAGGVHDDEDDAWTPLPGVRVDVAADGALLLDSPFLDPRAPRPLRAADRIALLAGGRFQHLGRADSIVKVGGERVSLAEIEQRLLSTDGVLDAAVLAIEDAGPRGSEICAVVVAPHLTVAQLRARLREWFDPIAVPRRIELVDRLPREATGKLRRQSLLTLLEVA